MNGIFEGRSGQKFEWIEAGQHKAVSNSDVTISFMKSRDNLVNITFRNGVIYLISSTDYVKITKPLKNRIYFKQGYDKDGLLLNKNKNVTADNRYVRFQNDDLRKAFDEFGGDYELKYDNFNELYYIEKEK